MDYIRNVELVDFDAPERATADHVDSSLQRSWLALSTAGS
jgi:hypothetical protein